MVVCYLIIQGWYIMVSGTLIRGASWNLRNKLQWNSIRNTKCFFQVNALKLSCANKKVVTYMLSICHARWYENELMLSRSNKAKSSRPWEPNTKSKIKSDKLPHPSNTWHTLTDSSISADYQILTLKNLFNYVCNPNLLYITMIIGSVCRYPERIKNRLNIRWLW